jgi:hypothetical protein
VTPIGLIDLVQDGRAQPHESANFIGTAFDTDIEIEVHPVSRRRFWQARALEQHAGPVTVSVSDTNVYSSGCS